MGCAAMRVAAWGTAWALAAGCAWAGPGPEAYPPQPCKVQLAQLFAEVGSAEQGANGAALGAANYESQARAARADAARRAAAGDQDGADASERSAQWLDGQARSMRVAMSGFQRAASAAGARRAELAKSCR